MMDITFRPGRPGASHVQVAAKDAPGANCWQWYILDVAKQHWHRSSVDAPELPPGEFVVLALAQGAHPAGSQAIGYRLTVTPDGTVGTWKRLSSPVVYRWVVSGLHAAQACAPLTLVAGSARSGTTLVQSVLCAGENTNPVTFEAVPFRVTLEGYRAVKAHMRVSDHAYFHSVGEVRDLYSDFLSNMRDRVAQKFGVEYLVLKEPVMSKFVDELTELFRSVRVVCIVRDPRDVFVSMRELAQKAEKRAKRNEFGWLSSEALAREIFLHYRRLMWRPLAEGDEQTLFCRYEDLVADPVQSVGRFERFTGLDLSAYDPGKDWPRSAIDFQRDDLHIQDAVTPLYGRAVSRTSVGRYKDLLDAQDLAAIETECHDLLVQFGYDFEHSEAG